jgi:DNA-binding GntR family transcriptional regulator
MTSGPTGGAGIARAVLADQVKDWLMARILEGTYPTNARIVETAVAKELGVSQAPVREALRGLEAVGLIDIAPYQGARVRALQPDELMEAYVVRSTLETLGARLAMARLDEEGVAAILSQGDDLYRAAEAGDLRAVALADARLHEQIMEASGNATLLRLWRSLEPVSRTLLTMLGPNLDLLWTAQLHDGMLEAVRCRDAASLSAAVEEHFSEVQSVVEKRFLDGPRQSGLATR